MAIIYDPNGFIVQQKPEHSEWGWLIKDYDEYGFEKQEQVSWEEAESIRRNERN